MKNKFFKFLTVSNECRMTLGRLSTLILLLFALSFGFSSQAWGNQGIVGITMYYNIDGTDKNYYYNNGNGDYNLGVISDKFKLTGLDIEVWDECNNCDDWDQGAMCWNGGEYKTVSKGDYDGNNFKLKASNCNYTIISAEGKSSGEYSLEHWFHAWGNNQDHYWKNGDNNCKWTYTILPPDVKDNNIVISTQNVYGGSGTEADPYLVASGVKPTFTVVTSGDSKTEQAHADANSVLWAKFKSGSSSWSTYSSTLSYEAVSTNIVNEVKQCTIMVKYRNDGANLDGTEATKIVYYKLKTTAVTLTGETEGSALAKYGVASMQDVVAPTKTGYNISTKAYYTQANFADETYYIMNNSGTLQKEIAGFTDANKKWINIATEVTLYTNWQPNTYKSGTLAIGNGTTAGSYEVTYDDTKITVKTTPTKEPGYHIEGYYLNYSEGEFSTKVADGDGNLVTTVQNYVTNGQWKYDGSVTLYTKWDPNTYTIAFDANGGSGEMASISNVAYDADQVLTTCTFSAPDNHHFIGWNTDGTATTALYQNGATVSRLTTTDGATITLYAIWEENASFYHITYDGNGATDGAVPTDATDYTPNAEVTVANNTGSLVKTGYNFTGWNSNAEGTGTNYSVGSTFNITGNITLYAKWIAKTYDLTLDNKGGTPENQILTVTYDATCPAFVAPTRTGYDYKGYVKQGTTSTQIINQNGSFAANQPGFTQDSRWIKDEAVTLDAKWTPNEYGFAIDANTGTSGACADKITFDETKLPITETYSKVGYNLMGYFTAATNGDKVANADGTLVTETVVGYVENGHWKRTEATTLYAQWQAKTYTISFDQNGGTGGQTETVTATYDQSMPSISGVPTRVGYKFKGYYSATSDGTQYYTANGTATANTWTNDAVGGTATIYAQWQQLYCFIEGRFHVATDKTRTNWTNTFDGSGHSDWYVESTKIPFTWNEGKKRYELATNATLKDLSGKISNFDPDFFIKQSTSSTSLANVKSYNFDGTLSSEAGVKNTMNAAEDKYCKFDSQDRSGYVTICFDETDIWFELEKVTLYDVTVQSFNGGSVDPSGTHKIGEISWTITANASEGYHFNRWTTTGGAVVENATDASTKVTATANGTVTANFAANTNLYFQKPGSWTGNEVWVYFDAWWNDDKGAGSSDKPAGKKMSDLGNGTYCLTYSGSEAGSSNIAFVNGKQDGYDPFYETSVSYRGDFKHCSSNNWFIPENKQTKKFDDKKTAYYNNGYWTSYYDRVEYYFMNSGSKPEWTQLEEYRFKNTNDHDIKRLEIQNVTEGTDIAFRIWQTCDCWFGVGAEGCVIKEDTKNYGLGTGEKDVTLKAWKTGSYEIIFNTNSKQLDVTYLGDSTVANFPGEVSTFVNRQHKVQPDVTLRNGTEVKDVTITVTGNGGTIADYEQNGTNLIITGKANGTETVTVTYKNNKDYVVERQLKVNVAEPIVIQAKLEKDEDENESTKDDYWSKTGLVHIHFWGSNAETAQDLSMSYNEDTKVFSVTAPKIEGFKFLFWYGEDINMSANEAWRKTNDITDCTTNTCYSISYGTDKDVTRTATPKTGLCSTDEYYVEITMKNGNTYKSNTISNLEQKVSFYAPKDNDETTYMQGSVRIVHNGAVSNPITGFAAAGVYVAKIASATAFAENSIELYTGNYYIRTDGAHGAWGDYKTDADNLMISFTPRAEKGETYSYYWVKNVAKTGTGTDGKVNVKADVANDYNDNLAGMIENDKFTDGGGYVYESTNGANVRFSYEPTTNEFKRAILGGSGNNNFLNVYSKTNNLYADDGHDKQLSEIADLNDSKFSDLSDWVYEKQVYVTADGSHAVNVILKSVFNGQTTHLLGYTKNEKGEDTDVPNELEVMGSQSTGDYALRITYDFKKNRLIASWEPGQREISTDMVIDSDVLFVQQEDADGTIDKIDVAQITYTSAGIEAGAKLTSLKNMIYVLEVTSTVIKETEANNQLYWICLPFDCRISDIYGVEGYVTLNAAGQPTDGMWGIQRYDGTTRASHGWFKEDNPEGFWRWMRRDEVMHAGTGYVVVFDKTGASSWPSIDVEEACTTGDDCVDSKHTVKKRLKRLYFPSIGSKFEISYSGETSTVVYANEPCNIEKRKNYDGNWKIVGPISYNNIGVDQEAANNLTYYYTYNQAATSGSRYVNHTIAELNNMRSFHGYMTQFGGDLCWSPFTKSNDVTVQAPRYTENPDFQGGMLTIELNNVQGTQLDRTFVNLHKNGTLGFDQNMELTKITENCAQIASVSEGVLYAGSTLPLDIELIPLNVKVVANGTYDIALKQSLEGLEVRLFDAFEQTTTPLDLMSATITLEKGEYKDRFFLQLTQKTSDTPTNLNGALEQYNLPKDKTLKLLNNGNIYLINSGRVYNATGTELR